MFITTPRLLMRSPEAADAGAVADYLLRNHTFLQPFEPVRTALYYTVAYQAQQLQQQATDWINRINCRFYISPLSDNDLIIGYVALNNIVMGDFCSCFLSYQLDQGYLNKGLTTEAVKEVVRFGFGTLQLHRIEANIMPQNRPSIRVAEKCGFTNEGLAQKYLRINGVWEDHFHYVRLNDDLE